MNDDFYFTHKKEEYTVGWEEENKILTLTFFKGTEEFLKKDIKLLGCIDHVQLKDIVTDHWKAFIKNELLN